MLLGNELMYLIVDGREKPLNWYFFVNVNWKQLHFLNN